MAAAAASQIEPGRAWRSKVRRVDLTEMVARAKRKSDAAAALARTVHTHTHTHAKGACEKRFRASQRSDGFQPDER